MEIVTPGIGLLFWTATLFLITLFLLSKFAFKPIATALKEREDSIDKALSASSKAKEEVAGLKDEIEEMKKSARAEKETILKEAKESAGKIVQEAQTKAKDESNRIIATAQEAIQSEKKAALTEMKQQVATFSLSIASKLIKQQLSNDASQKSLIQEYLKEANFN